MLDSLPFMPEMVQYCGMEFRVRKRLERTCDESRGEMRRIRDVVFLDGLRCQGSEHGGCQKGCMLFWKTQWLEKVTNSSQQKNQTQAIHPSFPFQVRVFNDEYICQSTELIRATAILPALDLRSYFRDLHAQTYTVRQLVCILSYALFLRIRYLLTGISYRVLEGSQVKTPIESLNLQAGEWVYVKSQEEIRATLDRKGKNRGLAFTVEMLPFCGRRFRVLRRLERMIHEPTRQLVKMDNTVILEDVTCDGCHIMRGGCPRENFHFWREIWLRRA